MIYAIISDLHANPRALEKVLADAKRCGGERVVCLGDVAGIGPDYEKTRETVRKAATITLRGEYDEDESAPITARLGEAVFVHGDMTEPSAFKRVDSCAAAADNFAATEATIIFVGHTHVPQLYLTGKSGEVYSLRAQDFTLEPGKRYIVDVGSVGYPREIDAQYFSSYVLYDETAKTVVFRRVPFDMDSLLGVGRKRRKSAMALTMSVGALGIVLAIGCLIMTMGKDSKPRLSEKTEVAAREEKTVRELRLADGQKSVHANLTLERKSDAATLTIGFLGGNGDVIKTQRETVRSFSKRAFAVPRGTESVRFEVTGENQGEYPLIRSFKPTAE